MGGVYEAQGNGLWDRFDFQDGSRVVVTAFGQTKTAEYVVMDDGRIRIMIDGDVVTLKDQGDGCLAPTAGDAREAQALRELGASADDLGLLGRYCRTGASRSGGGSQAAGAPSGRYRSSFGDDGIQLDFRGDGQVDVTIIEGAYQETDSTRYTMAGGQILIDVPDGPSLRLSERGGALETTMDGITMRFEPL
jgi:hypothetical protein